MIQILQHIHSKNFVHRDVKPDNFIMGLGPNNKFVYIIDLGFAKAYKDPRTLANIPISQKKGMTGTARYASINALKGFSQSRRDDLESLGYTIIELAKGCLPWSTITGNTKDELYDKILQSKINTSIDILCSGLPTQFKQYVEFILFPELKKKYSGNAFLSYLGYRVFDFNDDHNSSINLSKIKTNNMDNPSDLAQFNLAKLDMLELNKEDIKKLFYYNLIAYNN
jgi:serine/threonine protein kinase